MISFAFIVFVIIVVGGCIIYASIQMKRTGDMSNSALVGKGFDVKKAVDPQGYIDYIYMKAIMIGVVSILGGVLDIVNEKYLHIPYLGIVSSVIIFLVLIAYCVVASKAQKKFLSPKPREKK